MLRVERSKLKSRTRNAEVVFGRSFTAKCFIPTALLSRYILEVKQKMLRPLTKNVEIVFGLTPPRMVRWTTVFQFRGNFLFTDFQISTDDDDDDDDSM